MTARMATTLMELEELVLVCFGITLSGILTLFLYPTFSALWEKITRRTETVLLHKVLEHLSTVFHSGDKQLLRSSEKMIAT